MTLSIPMVLCALSAEIKGGSLLAFEVEGGSREDTNNVAWKDCWETLLTAMSNKSKYRIWRNESFMSVGGRFLTEAKGQSVSAGEGCK